jgi:anti-sigma-K factor RskA
MAATDKRPFRATALYNATQKRALAISTSMQPVAGKDYELWVIAGNAPPKPAGFLRFDASGVAVGEFDAALLRETSPDALAISLEPAGGGPTPTDVILLAKLRG